VRPNENRHTWLTGLAHDNFIWKYNLYNEKKFFPTFFKENAQLWFIIIYSCACVVKKHRPKLLSSNAMWGVLPENHKVNFLEDW
jgi:hypothetical protein